MNRTLVATAVSSLALALALGCKPPTIDSTPVVSAAQIQQTRAAHSRMLAEAPEAAFTRALGVLMDNGYLVRSSDKAAGLIAFHQDWYETGAHISLEGSLLFEPAEGGGTRVRALMAGNWRITNDRVDARVEDRVYTRLFNLLQPGPGAK